MTTVWPSDWGKLTELESLICCPICYEYITNVVIIPKCSHIFCSLCIRRYMSYKTSCPVCATPSAEPDLISHKMLDEIIKLYRDIRDPLFKVVNNSPQNVLNHSNNIDDYSKVENIKNRDDKIVLDISVAENIKKRGRPPNKRQIKDVKSDTSLKDVNLNPHASSISRSSSSCSISNSSFTQKNRIIDDSETSSDDDIIIPKHSKYSKPSSQSSPSTPSRNSSNEDFTKLTPKNEEKTNIDSPITPNYGRVNCPICSVEVSKQYINLHLDRCLNGPSSRDPIKRPTIKQKSMPKLVYNIMKDKEIQKRLIDVGLPKDGNRQTLIKRHQEFTLIWNSQCDVDNPKSGKEIATEVMLSEKVKKNSAEGSSKNIINAHKTDKKLKPEDVEASNIKYVNKHKSQFADLIADVKKRRKKALNEKSNCTAVVNQDENDLSLTDSKSDLIKELPNQVSITSVAEYNDEDEAQSSIYFKKQPSKCVSDKVIDILDVESHKSPVKEQNSSGISKKLPSLPGSPELSNDMLLQDSFNLSARSSPDIFDGYCFQNEIEKESKFNFSDEQCFPLSQGNSTDSSFTLSNISNNDIEMKNDSTSHNNVDSMKPLKLKSKSWKYFKKTEDGQAECLLCGDIVKRPKGSPSAMMAHLRKAKHSELNIDSDTNYNDEGFVESVMERQETNDVTVSNNGSILCASNEMMPYAMEVKVCEAAAVTALLDGCQSLFPVSYPNIELHTPESSNIGSPVGGRNDKRCYKCHQLITSFDNHDYCPKCRPCGPLDSELCSICKLWDEPRKKAMRKWWVKRPDSVRDKFLIPKKVSTTPED